MKVRYLTVIVDRGPMEKIPTEVMAHEGPLLELVHGGMDNLKVVGERLVEVEDIDPAAEYERLLAKYGVHPDTKQPHIAMVYGGLAEGRFEKALFAGAPKKAKAKAPPPPEPEPEPEEEGELEGSDAEEGELEGSDAEE